MDSARFEQIFRSRYANLVGYAESFTGAREDAEEIVSDVLAHVFERWDSLGFIGDDSRLRGYLFRSVRNRLLNHLRSQRRTVAREEQAARDMESTSNDPLTITDSDDRAAALDRAVAALPDRAREVIALHWNHGLTYEEIAESLGITAAAAKMQASRAIKQLRERLSEE